MLEGVGRCWKVLEGVGRCWKVLEGVGRCWKVLEGVGLLLSEKNALKDMAVDGVDFHGNSQQHLASAQKAQNIIDMFILNSYCSSFTQ